MQICSVDQLKSVFETKDLTEYRSIPFWSWNNTLEISELLRQIDDMKAVGMGGFIMHARIGLKDEYMGKHWFDCIEACLDHAKKLGMRAWIYDENGWPSGFVGGTLLSKTEFLAQYLAYEVKPEFDPEAFAVYQRREAEYARIEAPVKGLAEYHCVYRRYSPANTDILNPEVVSAFIEQTHEEYYKRFANRFGKELVGFFTDEPQFYRWATPYSPWIAQAYEQECGEDVRNGLIYLFTRDEVGIPFRVRYYTVTNRVYTENFYKRLYDWCEEHGCLLTGHSVEESTLYAQMMGGAGVMPSYEYEHIPGVDCLGRDWNSTLMPMQVGSVASQLGIKQVLTETFACCGHDTTPQELKNVAEFQYFHGVNLMCQHLFPYSLSAQGKSDHPPVFSRQNNWFEQFRTFNEYFTRLGYLVANTEETVDLLLIHPMRAVYTDYLFGHYGGELQERFEELIYGTFRNKGIRFHLGDESILARHATADGDTLTVGKCKYTTVVIPDMKTIASSTVELLKRYQGKLLCMGTLDRIDGVPADVPLSSNITLEDVIANAGVSFRCDAGRVDMTTRQGELGEYLFINNLSRTESGTFTAKGMSGQYRALDLLTMERTNVTDTVTLDPSGSLILVRDPNAREEQKYWAEEPLKSHFEVSRVTENILVRDFAQLSFDGENYGEKLHLQRIFEDLLRLDYRGRIWIKQTFTVKDQMPLTLMMEKGNNLCATLNGYPVEFVQSAFDILFMEADITNAVKTGENVFVYSVDYYQHEGVNFALFDPHATESLRNCLYYDTHLEPIFIKGEFVLDAEHTICPKTTLPPITDRMFEVGYPFFKGELTYTGAYTYDGHGARVLELRGRFLVAEVTVNGKRRDFVFDTKADITDLLVIGKNDITIVLRSSLRNMFGPFHQINETFNRTRPLDFTFRGQWNGGVAPEFTPTYHSAPFGLSDLVMNCEDRLIRVKHERNLVYATEVPAAMKEHMKPYLAKLQSYPKLAKMYENGYLHTAHTVLDRCEDGTYFLVSGDIQGMWLRDSSTQVTHYTPIAQDDEIASIIEGVLRRQFRYITIDPYANAFNRDPNGNGHIDDEPLQSVWVFERKYEIDSLCYPIRLLYLYWKHSGREELIRESLETVAREILKVWRTEQHHMEQSPYRFIRQNPPVPWDTIPNEGMGTPVAYTGMTWSAFRPSDDGCSYGYLTASEMFASVVLSYMAEMLQTVLGNREMAKECLALKADIDEGIRKYCIVEHEKYGKIYACETDGMGHYSLIDDANIPSLLSIPYIGYATVDDEIYQNTRRFLLSSDNPFYFEGTAASGIGSRHTPDGYIWHMAMVMQGMTSSDPEEKRKLLHLIATTDAGTGYLHEGFDANAPENYTRDWFTWPNSLYAEFIEQCIDEGIL